MGPSPWTTLGENVVRSWQMTSSGVAGGQGAGFDLNSICACRLSVPVTRAALPPDLRAALPAVATAAIATAAITNRTATAVPRTLVTKSPFCLCPVLRNPLTPRCVVNVRVTA